MPRPRKSTTGTRGGRGKKQSSFSYAPQLTNLEKRKILPFEKSLATTLENVPPVTIHDVVAPLTYMNQNSRVVRGDDPYWEQPWGFEGHIRAPFDKKTTELGIFPNAHVYELNPLAGRGTDNLSFLATDPTALIKGPDGTTGYEDNIDDPLSEQPETQYFQPMNPEAQYRPLEPGGPTYGTETQYDQDGRIINETRRNLFEYDRNVLQSAGVEMMDDPHGNSFIEFQGGSAIPFFADGSIYEVKPDPDKLDDIQDDFVADVQYWNMWYGHRPQIRTARPEIPTDELLFTGNPFQQALTGAFANATEYQLEHKGIGMDEQRAQDSIPFQRQQQNQSSSVEFEIDQANRDMRMMNGY